MRARMVMVMLLLALGLTACDKKPSDAGNSAGTAAAPIGAAECSACGMVVREQPAPRGQVVHADGKRVHLCSIGDLVQYLAEPSPHGKPTAIYVETLDPAQDPKQNATEERPWAPAESAGYVVGVERRGIMGKPVLAYPSRELAVTAAARHKGQPKQWSELHAHVTSH